MTTDSATREVKEYWHGLAALRALAMLLGIVLHSAVPFMAQPLAGLGSWNLGQAPTLICDISTWWIHLWRIPTFFFLAGFFALQTLQRHGVADFTKKRFYRLVVPYVVALYAVGPVVYMVFRLLWCQTGQCSWDYLWPHIALPEGLAENSFGPAHLWFLQEIIILTAAFVALHVAFSQGRKTADPRFLNLPWWAPLAPGVLTGLMLWSDPSPLLEFHNTFLCVPPRLLYFSVFFIGGVIAYRHRRTFFGVTEYYQRHLTLAAILSVAYLWLRLSGVTDITAPVGSFLFSLVAGLLCWLMVYGLIGGCNEWFRRPHPVVGYLSDASYWVYIVHLPVVLLTQLAVYQFAWSSGAKFGVVVLTTTCICLTSYQLFARYTLIGMYLHGQRSRLNGKAHTSKILHGVSQEA